MTGKMFIKSDIGNITICRGRSIFTKRNNIGTKLDDCVIRKECRGYGLLEKDGRRYTIIAIIACESGEYIRKYGKMPKEIHSLKLWGMVDKDEGLVAE